MQFKVLESAVALGNASSEKDTDLSTFLSTTGQRDCCTVHNEKTIKVYTFSYINVCKDAYIGAFA